MGLPHRLWLSGLAGTDHNAQLFHSLPIRLLARCQFSVMSTEPLLLSGPERALDPSANSAEPDHTFNAKCRQGADYLLLK